MTHNVTAIHGGDIKTLQASHGQSLLLLLRDNGIRMNALCNGRGTCGGCEVIVDGENRLACEYFITKDITVKTIHSAEDIFSDSGVINILTDTDIANFAIDIGTTTVAIALLDNNGNPCDTVSINNAQVSYGADVISRINAVISGDLNAMQRVLIMDIDKAITTLVTRHNLSKYGRAVISGNTTMLHIFFGIDCSAMGFAPYTPVFLGERTARSTELGFTHDFELTSMPNIASFVGSDIVAGILHVQGNIQGNMANVLIDFGTNAEIAIWNNDTCLVTAAAAGPCFEGANISCGMSATSGAIKRYSIIGGVKTVETIGNAKTVGICGTGLIDIIAEIIRSGVIDENGGFNELDEYPVTGDIVITQKDIREFQLAKSAIRSGLESLLLELNASYNNVNKLYLAGGFSCYIDTENAAICGLIPPELVSKCVAVANTSLKGAIDYYNSKTIPATIKNAKYLDLGANVAFNRFFMEYMCFNTEDYED